MDDSLATRAFGIGFDTAGPFIRDQHVVLTE